MYCILELSLAHLAGVGPETALGGEALAADVAVEGSVLEPLDLALVVPVPNIAQR